MIEVDQAGIARTQRRLGDEGATVLLLRTTDKVSGAELDEATPQDDGDSPGQRRVVHDASRVDAPARGP